MSRVRSVGTQLSAALLVVVAIALGIVYLLVVPPLEDRLVEAKVTQLERAVPGWAARSFNAFEPDWVDIVAESTNARAAVLEYYSRQPPALRVLRDSRQGAPSDLTDDPVALRAAATLESTSGTVIRRGQRFAEAAAPISSEYVLLLTASLEPSLDDVAEVEQSLLIGGVLALLVALAIGYGGAWLFARRIRRLEQAAERIAHGSFDQPIVDARSDELGELARAFDRMRIRLAHLDDARREFVANASHELRTPLFSLGGFLELMRDEDVDEATRRDFLEAMSEQVERLTKLATDLLDLTRLDAGRLRIEEEPVDLGAIAASLVDEFSAVARASDHPLSIEAADGVFASADDERVVRVGRALLENALVHTPPGTPVRVSVRTEAGLAVLAVADEGPGLPATEQDEIFERFYRIDGTKASGSGLGLAIARELAEAMGGSLRVDSRPGHTEFRLVLRPAVRTLEPV